MKTKRQNAIVTIAAERTLRGNVVYRTLEDLCASIEGILSKLYRSGTGMLDDDAITITLPNGRSYHWLGVYAHYCFDHGRITETRMVNELFSAERALC